MGIKQVAMSNCEELAVGKLHQAPALSATWGAKWPWSVETVITASHASLQHDAFGAALAAVLGMWDRILRATVVAELDHCPAIPIALCSPSIERTRHAYHTNTQLLTASQIFRKPSQGERGEG